MPHRQGHVNKVDWEHLAGGVRQRRRFWPSWDAWMVAFEPGDRDELNGTSATNIRSPEMAPASLTTAARGGRVIATSYRPSYDVIKGFRGSQSHRESDGQLGKVNCRWRRAQQHGFR
jgi:hypothetical protein